MNHRIRQPEQLGVVVLWCPSSLPSSLYLLVGLPTLGLPGAQSMLSKLKKDQLG